MVFFAEELGSKLDEYIATLSVPVFAIRSPERTGLIRARLKGIYFILINNIIMKACIKFHTVGIVLYNG